MKLKLNFQLNSKALMVLLPVFPLVDFMLIKSFPYCTLVAYLIVILFSYDYVSKGDYVLSWFTITTIISIVINGLLKDFTLDQFKYIICFFTFSLYGIKIGRKSNSYIDFIIRFAYMYFFVNTAIFVYRLLVFQFDFNRVRNGTAIFGGNSAHFVFLMVLLFLKDFPEKKKQYYYILVISILNSIFYISKGAIVFTFAWVVLDVLNQRKTHALNWKTITFIFIIALFLRFYLLDRIGNFLSFTISRFTIWEDLFKSTGGIMGTRGKVFEFCIQYIKQNPIILLFGNGPTFFRSINPWGYSNSHNLFMDVLIDIGIIGLILFIVLCFKTIINCKNKIFYLLCICYATFEGVALFFIDGTSPIMTGFAFLFIVAYYSHSKIRENDYCANDLLMTQKAKIVSEE